jgi:membrane protein YdbS with pleckstrin-like domain
MRCNQCGAEAPAQAAFCPQCGAQLGRAGTDVGRSAGVAKIRPSGPPGTAHDVSEQDLWSGAYSPKAMAGAFICATLLAIAGMVAASFAGPAGWTAVAIGALVVFGYLGLQLLYRHMSVRYRLTTQRLLREIGILSRTDDRILVVDIDDIKVEQGPIERLFNLGTIVLVVKDESTKDEIQEVDGKGVMKMIGIENPRHVADLIDEARRAERSRRGVYMMNA